MKRVRFYLDFLTNHKIIVFKLYYGITRAKPFQALKQHKNIDMSMVHVKVITQLKWLWNVFRAKSRFNHMSIMNSRLVTSYLLSCYHYQIRDKLSAQCIVSFLLLCTVVYFVLESAISFQKYSAAKTSDLNCYSYQFITCFRAFLSSNFKFGVYITYRMMC